jgi:hypothetical protein
MLSQKDKIVIDELFEKNLKIAFLSKDFMVPFVQAFQMHQHLKLSEMLKESINVNS